MLFYSIMQKYDLKLKRQFTRETSIIIYLQHKEGLTVSMSWLSFVITESISSWNCIVHQVIDVYCSIPSSIYITFIHSEEKSTQRGLLSLFMCSNMCGGKNTDFIIIFIIFSIQNVIYIVEHLDVPLWV